MYEWLKELKAGDTVIIGGFSPSVHTVKRTTATQIVLRSYSQKFRRSDGSIVGGSGYGGMLQTCIEEATKERIEVIERSALILSIGKDDWSMCSLKTLNSALLTLIKDEGKLSDSEIPNNSIKVDWNAPDKPPIVERWNSKQCWIAVESAGQVRTSLARYQNYPLEQCEDGCIDERTMFNEDDEAVNSVGWHVDKSSATNEDLFVEIEFSDTYRLLGWAEYLLPEFSA
jgi:hypothetical protein